MTRGDVNGGVVEEGACNESDDLRVDREDTEVEATDDSLDGG